MNNWNGIGRLTKDPELRYTKEQYPVCNFTLAVDRFTKQGKTASFIPVKSFGKTAENCARFLTKGKQTAISGEISTGSYEKDGRTIYTWEILAHEVTFVGAKDEKKESPANGTYEQANANPQAVMDSLHGMGIPATWADDDIPF